MRYMSITTLAAALAVGSAGLVHAQGSSQQFGQGSGGQQQFSQDRQNFRGQQQFEQGYGGSRFQQRSALRRQLQQVGFQNIRILDAAYLVQAQTPDGRTVIMVVDPPAQMGMAGMGGQMGQTGQRFGAQQQFDQMGRMGQRDQRFGTAQGRDMSGRGGQQGTFQAQGSVDQNRGEATGAVDRSGRMSLDQVRKMLQERGLSNIENLEREGDTFTASADWQGEQVDLRVNAITGEITQPAQL